MDVEFTSDDDLAQHIRQTTLSESSNANNRTEPTLQSIIDASSTSRQASDLIFQNMCARLPSAMHTRGSFMPYTPDIPYLNSKLQMTDVRGHLECADQLFDEQQRASEEYYRELFQDIDDGLADIGSDDDLLNDQVPMNIAQEDRDAVDENQIRPRATVNERLRQEPTPTQEHPPVRTMPAPLPAEVRTIDQDNAYQTEIASMLDNVMQQQVTFITAPLPKHVEQERARKARYAQHGITDPHSIVDNCILCSYMTSTTMSGSSDTRILDKCMRDFRAICNWAVRRPMHVTCVAASTYWNKEFVVPCEKFGLPSPPKITPSHVELCLLNCNHNLKGLLTLRREISMLEDTLDVLRSNQLYVRQEIAGVPTNKFQVTQSGYKVMHDLMNLLSNLRKLEWGAMTVIERESGSEAPVTANPMHDSALKPRKRNELTREREAIVAANKRNSKNFRGSSGMGSQIGVAPLQLGGYSASVTGNSVTRAHQATQRHQLFSGGI